MAYNNKFLEKKYILIYFLLLFFDSLSGKSWNNEKQMDDNFRLHWNIKWDKIYFELEVRSHGYLGIGFSKDGSLENADICLGYVEDDTAIVQDFHTQDGRLQVDDSQDCEAAKATQNRTHTIFRFHRRLETCDLSGDYAIKNTTINLLYFYTDFKMKQKSIVKKSLPNLTEIYKGSMKLNLNLNSNQPAIKFDSSTMRKWELRNQDVELPLGDDTIYWCKFFKLPEDLFVKHHLIRFEPVYDSNESINYLRHMNLYECQGSSAALEMLVREQGRMCVDARSPNFTCSAVVTSWISKSKGFTFPSEAGIPVDPKLNTFYMMESHYTNLRNPNDFVSEPSTVVDSSGLNLYLTSRLRKHDAGIMSVGVEPNWRHIIPPGHRNVFSEGHCVGECTKRSYPPHGINLLAVMFRTNAIGKMLKFKIVRKNVEHELAVDENVEQQEFRLLDRPYTSLPGDHLIVDCVYDSSQRGSITLGGVTLKGETCQAMTVYYPKINELSACNSMSSLPTVLQSLGIEELAMDSNPVVIASPTELAGMTFESRLVSYDWQNNFDKFQEITRRGEFIPVCRNAKNDLVAGTESLVAYSPTPTKIIKSRDNCDSFNPQTSTYTTGIDLEQNLATSKTKVLRSPLRTENGFNGAVHNDSTRIHVSPFILILSIKFFVLFC